MNPKRERSGIFVQLLPSVFGLSAIALAYIYNGDLYITNFLPFGGGLAVLLSGLLSLYVARKNKNKTLGWVRLINWLWLAAVALMVGYYLVLVGSIQSYGGF